MQYNWQLPQWPGFVYDVTIVNAAAARFGIAMGELKGLSVALSEKDQQEALLQLMIAEAAKTSEIEGEIFSREDLISSIKKKLGIHAGTEIIRDKKAQGIASLMVHITESYQQKLSQKMIKDWHKVLMENRADIHPGAYRKSGVPMQVISGAYGKETIHFEAPPSSLVPLEMKNFIRWYARSKVTPDDIVQILIKASLTHLYFESIHPFEDGNGRIGRALAEKCLSESLNRLLLVSLSVVIERDKKRYYRELKKAQRTLEVTDWIGYFSKIITDGMEETKLLIEWSVNKMKFLDKYRAEMNPRQNKAVLKILEAGAAGFSGGMTAKKYTSINKTSRATATRDLQELAVKGILVQSGQGRNVAYQLNLP